MTVPVQDPVTTHTANGVTTVFSFDFLCIDPGDIKVYVNYLEVSNYTVTNYGSNAGGSITFDTSPDDGLSVIIRLDVVLDRDVNYQYTGDFMSPVVNKEFDRLWLSQQSQQTDLKSSVKFPPGEEAGFLPAISIRKGKALVFNAETGDPEPSEDNYNDQAAAAAASAAAAETSNQSAFAAASAANSSEISAAASAQAAADHAASVDPQLLATGYFGSVAPAITWPGMVWADNGTNTIWRRNEANDGWIAEGTLFARSIPGLTFAQIVALATDQGPIFCTDMNGGLYTWQTSAYFSGYRSGLCGKWIPGWTPDPLAWMIEAIGGTWDESDDKEKRVIARYQESGLVVDIDDWIVGQNMIASLGSGQWKAPDLQNMVMKMTGTDVDTANARSLGTRQKGSIVTGNQLVAGVTGIANMSTQRANWGLESVDPSDIDARTATSASLASTLSPVPLNNLGSVRVTNTSTSPYVHI